MSNLKVYYLFNSGFAVETDSKVLIFDYYKNKNVLNSVDFSGKDLYIFSSHRHKDHFKSKIFSWKFDAISTKFILSYDIKRRHALVDIHTIKPYESLALEGIKINAFDSTDEGVSFLVEADGTKFFHAGDLNWWYWQTEQDEWNDGIEKKFKAEIDKIVECNPKYAFLPVDPRLGHAYSLGLKYYLSKALNLDELKVFPMHFGSKYSIFQSLKNDGLSDNVVDFTKSGLIFEL